jgi:hypothetical protein
MILSKDAIVLFEQYQINLTESVLIKMEDAIRKDHELILTIDASHYGFRNNNGTVYRHDTMMNDVQSFVYPSPKPIIERHRPETSAIFGNVIAADYKLTKYHSDLLLDIDLDGLTTKEYIEMCKDDILPLQKRDKKFNGLAYVQVIGKLTHKDGIQKVLDGEFLSVSIGAAPKRLICSECLQDQVQGICEHFVHKVSGRFMLAESIEYEELSFVPRPADPFGRVVRIHDGLMETQTVEHDINILNSDIDVMYIKDFFKEAEGKTIVCVDNICTIINEEEQEMKRKNLSLADEFSAEILKVALENVKLEDEEKDVLEELKLTDDVDEWTSMKFAIVQKTQDGEVRRFPLHTKTSVQAGLALIDKAEDLTEAEMKKAVSKLGKAAKKFGIELADETTETQETTEEVVVDKVADTDSTTEESTDASGGSKLDALLDELKAELVKEPVENLEDSVPDPANPKKDAVTRIFDLLKWYSVDQAVAAKSLNSGISSFLEEAGKEAISKGQYDELQVKASGLEDSVKSLEDGKADLETKFTELTSEVESLRDECEILEEANKDLNFELRAHLVDELVANKISLGILEDAEVETTKAELARMPYSAIKMQVGDSRKLTAKLKGTVNNTIGIKTVTDPTLQDQDNSDKGQSPTVLKDEEAPRLSEEQIAKGIARLFSR